MLAKDLYTGSYFEKSASKAGALKALLAALSVGGLAYGGRKIWDAKQRQQEAQEDGMPLWKKLLLGAGAATTIGAPVVASRYKSYTKGLSEDRNAFQGGLGEGMGIPDNVRHSMPSPVEAPSLGGFVNHELDAAKDFASNFNLAEKINKLVSSAEN